MKRFAMLAIAGIMASALFACGGESSKSGDKTEAAPAAPAAAPAPAAPAAPAAAPAPAAPAETH